MDNFYDKFTHVIDLMAGHAEKKKNLKIDRAYMILKSFGHSNGARISFAFQ